MSTVEIQHRCLSRAICHSQPPPWGCCGADRFARRKKRGKLAAERAVSQLARAICQQAHQKDVVISARFRAALAAVSARRSDDGPAAARMRGRERAEHPQLTDEWKSERRVCECAYRTRWICLGEIAQHAAAADSQKRTMRPGRTEKNGGCPGCVICDESRVAAWSSCLYMWGGGRRAVRHVLHGAQVVLLECR